MDKMLTVKEMAERSGFSVMYFYSGHSTGKLTLPLTKIGRSLRCRESIFEKWLNGEEVPAPEPRGEKKVLPHQPWLKRRCFQETAA
jgi:hypothetical protein